jgi:hypothetical protein
VLLCKKEKSALGTAEYEKLFASSGLIQHDIAESHKPYFIVILGKWFQRLTDTKLKGFT